MSVLNNEVTSTPVDALAAHNKAILDDVSSVDVVGKDIVGTIFVIPLEAALPEALRESVVNTGTLYKRLATIDGLAEDQDFGFLALSGLELSDLSQVWTDFACPNKIMVLQDLPGVMYSTMFVVGYKQIGLPVISWPMVSTALQARDTARQRTFDLNPSLSPKRQGAIRALKLTPGEPDRSEVLPDDDYDEVSFT